MSGPFLAAPPLDGATFARVRARAILEHCKWDPQVGDVATLSPSPLILTPEAWQGLQRDAEALTAELLEAEAAILASPKALSILGLPHPIHRALLHARHPISPGAGRVMRFDFHWTDDGWRISEVNSDVPGGYAESTGFTELMAEHYPDLQPTGLPGRVWAQALAGHERIVLLSTPGFPEDQQVNCYLARELAAVGVTPLLAGPRQLEWRDREAFLHGHRIDLIWRFYQGEWLPRIRRGQWLPFFRGSRTPVANPGVAIISESKRFPLAWGRLAMPTWRRLLPESADPRQVPWRRDASWLLKPAFCSTGDHVYWLGRVPEKAWRDVGRDVFWRPQAWVAQRRFHSDPHICIGVYTVNGRAAGCYGRISPGGIIDEAAVDAAVLVPRAV